MLLYLALPVNGLAPLVLQRLNTLLLPVAVAVAQGETQIQMVVVVVPAVSVQEQAFLFPLELLTLSLLERVVLRVLSVHLLLAVRDQVQFSLLLLLLEGAEVEPVKM